MVSEITLMDTLLSKKKSNWCGQNAGNGLTLGLEGDHSGENSNTPTEMYLATHLRCMHAYTLNMRL